MTKRHGKSKQTVRFAVETENFFHEWTCCQDNDRFSTAAEALRQRDVMRNLNKNLKLNRKYRAVEITTKVI